MIARLGHTATRLADGRVLVVGGFIEPETTGGFRSTRITESYDPESGTWTRAGDLVNEEDGFLDHTATTLEDGRVLVIGLFAELYSPVTGLWRETGNFNPLLDQHTATRLPDGNVLVVGGRHERDDDASSCALIYDTATEEFRSRGENRCHSSPQTRRRYHTATPLTDGRVLVTGGITVSTVDDPSVTATSELYDPATETWTVTGSLAAGRAQHSATLLAGGQVLVVGGASSPDASGSLAGAELYDFLQLRYPQLALGGGFEVVLLVTNQGEEDWRGLGVLDDGAWPVGRPWSLNGKDRTGQSGFFFQLAPDQTHKFTLASTGPAFSGFLAIQGNNQTADLATSFFYNFFAGGELEDSTGVGVSAAMAAVSFPVERSARVNTGIVVRFLSQERVSFRLYDEAGTFLQTSLDVEGAVFFDELFTGVPENFVGSIQADSPQPFHIGVLRQELIPGPELRFQLTSVPTTPISRQAQHATWVATGRLNTARVDHTATLLPDGLVMVAGGQAFSMSTAEIYDPALGSWAFTSNLNTPRSDHTATHLGNGFVLVAGGRSNQGTTASAELYNPFLNKWFATESLNTPRDTHTATLLADGRVLVAGGFSDDGRPTDSAELYNPDTFRWSSTGNLRVARRSHSATLLPDGRVWVAGGIDADAAVTPRAELYDPDTGQWMGTGNLRTARFVHSATLLEDDRVLIAGGLDSTINPLASAELYDPAAGFPTPIADLFIARSFHSASLLGDGRVLIAGGARVSRATEVVELYDPVEGRWTIVGSLATPRRSHSATVLADDRVLVAGGVDDRSTTTPTAEVYNYVREVYPLLALGGGFEVILLASNQSQDDFLGVAQLDGGAWPLDRPWALDGENRTGQSSFEIRLGPRQTQKFRLSGTRDTATGWLEIKSPKLVLATSYFYNFFSNPTTEFGRPVFEDSTGVGAARRVTAVSFPVERSSSVNTGLAIRESQAALDFTLYEAGTLLETKMMRLEGGLFFSEIFDSVRQDFIGSLKVVSPKPFFITVLRQELIPGPQLRFQLTSVPATPVP